MKKRKKKEGGPANLGNCDYGEIIGPRIRELRKAKRLTRSGLSNRLKEVGLDVSGSVLWTWETGKRWDFTLRDITALAYALECEIEDLWPIPDREDLRRESDE